VADSAGRCPGWLLLFLFLFSQAAAFGSQQPQFLELRGQILTSDGKPVPGRPVIPVTLQGVHFPYDQRQLAMSGRFRFQKLTPGLYKVLGEVPGFGELLRTVEVSPALAKKNRVEVELRLAESAAAARRGAMTSVRELAIPERARNEMDSAYEDMRAPRGERAAAAIQHLERAIEIEPRFVEAINLLGTIHYQRSEYKQAEECFRRALTIEATAYEPLVNLGGVLINLGQFQEALQLNRQAVAARPDDALARAQLGLALFSLGNYPEAIASLTRAKQIDPNHFTFPQLVLADIYARQGRLTEAVAELEDFLKRHPDVPLAASVRSSLPNLKAQIDPKTGK